MVFIFVLHAKQSNNKTMTEMKLYTPIETESDRESLLLINFHITLSCISMLCI